jgi:hypothetical protein
MKEKIKKDIEYISKDKNNVCNNSAYLKLLNHLYTKFDETSIGMWLQTAQYHNAQNYVRSFPELSGKIDKSLNQLVRLAGGYVIEVTKDKYRWNECEYDEMGDVAECIWNKES